MNLKAQALFNEGYEKILAGISALGYDPDNDPNFQGTAARAARGLSELIQDTTESQKEIDALLERTEPT